MKVATMAEGGGRMNFDTLNARTRNSHPPMKMTPARTGSPLSVTFSQNSERFLGAGGLLSLLIGMAASAVMFFMLRIH
jgi:hypothetical protein